MLESIKDDIKKTFLYGNMVNKILIVNLAVFVVVLLLSVFLQPFEGLYTTILRNLQISADPLRTLLRPWTVISHMFLHTDVWHIFWNMILFYWFGRITGDLIGDDKVLPIYIYGGLFGGLIYMITYNLMGITGPSFALGASAAVMAIIMVAALTAPDYTIRLFFIGDVKIKYIALAMIILDIAGTAKNYNTLGHFAHLGGVLFGWFYVSQARVGNDLSIGFNNMIDKMKGVFSKEKAPVKAKSPLKVKYKSRNITKAAGSRKSDSNHVPHQERVDAILEKIKAKGYDSLSDEEKEFLFQASKK